jgi:phosphoadenosine phosphosulfate reductase
MPEALLEKREIEMPTKAENDPINLDFLNHEFIDLSPEQRIVRSNEVFGGRVAVASTLSGPTAPVLLEKVSRVAPESSILVVKHGHETTHSKEIATWYEGELGLNVIECQAPKWPVPDDDDQEGLRDFQEWVKVRPFELLLKKVRPEAFLSGVMRWQTPERQDLPFIQKQGDVYKINPVLDLSEGQVDEFFKSTGFPRNNDYYDPAKGSTQRKECQLNTTEYYLDERTNELNLTETDILTLLSQGNRARGVATRLGIELKTVEEAKRSIPEKLGTTNIASATAKAINDKIIQVKDISDTEITDEISPLEIGILQAYSEGGSEKEISSILGAGFGEARKVEKDFFRKIGVRARPHAVRRGYELGIL